MSPGWPGCHAGARLYPLWKNAGVWNANCTSPPRATPTAAARIGSGSTGTSTTTVVIIVMLSIAGARAGTKKTRLAFSEPMTRAARLMNTRNGNIILVRRTVRENFSGSSR